MSAVSQTIQTETAAPPMTARHANGNSRPGARSVAQIRALLQAHRVRLAQHYHVSSIGIFGSYAFGQANTQSDLDILVEFSQTPNLFQMMDMEDELSNLLDIPIDLVTRRSLRGEIGRRILAEVVPV